jgi:hypothetical protein
LTQNSPEIGLILARILRRLELPPSAILTNPPSEFIEVLSGRGLIFWRFPGERTRCILKIEVSAESLNSNKQFRSSDVSVSGFPLNSSTLQYFSSAFQLSVFRVSLFDSTTQ